MVKTWESREPCCHVFVWLWEWNHHCLHCFVFFLHGRNMRWAVSWEKNCPSLSLSFHLTLHGYRCMVRFVCGFVFYFAYLTQECMVRGSWVGFVILFTLVWEPHDEVRFACWAESGLCLSLCMNVRENHESLYEVWEWKSWECTLSNFSNRDCMVIVILFGNRLSFMLFHESYMPWVFTCVVLLCMVKIWVNREHGEEWTPFIFFHESCMVRVLELALLSSCLCISLYWVCMGFCLERNALAESCPSFSLSFHLSLHGEHDFTWVCMEGFLSLLVFAWLSLHVSLVW